MSTQNTLPNLQTITQIGDQISQNYNNTTNFFANSATLPNQVNKVDSTYFADNLKDSNIHPSFFEDDTKNITANLTNKRTLMSINVARDEILGTKDISTLKSPGAYKFTTDDDSLKGSNTRFMFKNLYGETPLTFLFFSEENINNIQNLIKLVVFKNTGQVIDKQSVVDLQIILRSIFLSYSEHPLLFDPLMSPQEIAALKIQYTNEVARLNELCIAEIVPRVVSGLQQYISYLKDASSGLQIMDKPVLTRDQRQYRSITNLLSGGL